MITALHHVQLAMPRGKEDEARAFYVGVLGFTEVPKPSNLVTRGGLWLTSGTADVHLGVEDEFRPAKKAHPALLVGDLAALRARCEGLLALGTVRFHEEADAPKETNSASKRNIRTFYPKFVQMV